jgi:hypothetical protein
MVFGELSFTALVRYLLLPLIWIPEEKGSEKIPRLFFLHKKTNLLLLSFQLEFIVSLCICVQLFVDVGEFNAQFVKITDREC